MPRKSQEYDDIPGTFVFDAERSRQGYGINMFCMSLMKEENRKAFKANEAEYLKRFQLTDEQRELSGKSVTLGPPPEAQLVYDHARGSVGVAIRGARRVVELPKGYGGAGAELGMIDDGMFVLTQPDRSPLMINPHTGIARPF